ncbi:MAG: IclR family transcriptional regulator [Tateyamaria sp.]|uniref:IclR family transcriptional regulator n=1 Tax=Tateyamaria sp. TaxID=1929288 RepID=UPI00329FB642
MPNDTQNSEKAQIAPNLRLLAIIEEVARAGVPVTPGALSDAVGIPVPTIHRLLSTAEDEGLLQRDVDGRSYGPGRRMRRMSGNILSSQRIRTERLLVMKALAEKVGETCNLAAPARYGMVYLDRVETHWPLRIQLAVGALVPFHCTASGKMYLSSLRSDKLNRVLKWLELERRTDKTITDREQLKEELANTRQRDYATDDQEFMDGMTALAVPIKDGEGRLLSTLSIHAPEQRQEVESLVKQLSDLQRAAQRIEELCVS